MKEASQEAIPSTQMMSRDLKIKDQLKVNKIIQANKIISLKAQKVRNTVKESLKRL